ncbi:MAG TPA: cupin domain-containing protein [Ornithinibacter sp.]|nr:cupin domain-containing protein [Ornithinibacter sp.]
MAPLPPVGGHGLGWLVALDRETFAEQHWGRRPLLTRAADRPAGVDVFGPDAVDELISRRALRTPFLRMAKDGRTLDPTTFTLGGGVGAAISDQVSEDRVLRHFADGATIVLQALHRTWPPVADAAQGLAADLGHPVQVNAYVTPPQNRGFDDHYDVHDVFVLQVTGEKHWQVRPPVIEFPRRDQPWTDHRDAVRLAAEGPPTVDVVLAPGDCLYVPRGWLHSATALGGTSIHLTMGVHVWTRRQLADDLLTAVGRRLDADPAVRASLGLGVDPLDAGLAAGLRDGIRAAVDAALDAVTDDELAAALARRVRSAQRAEPLGVLGQHAATADPDTVWRPRRHLAARWEWGRSAGVVTLVTRVARVDVPADHRAAVMDVLAGHADAAALDPGVRRSLCLAGLLVPADDA